MKNSKNQIFSAQLATMLTRFSSRHCFDKIQPEPYLVIVSGNDLGKHFKLHRPRTFFGRDQNTHICISDPKISRQHGVLSICPDSNHIFLEDLNSSNGTFVNGRRIEKYKIELLDRIRVGDTYLKIDYKIGSEAQSELEILQAATTDALTAILNRHAFMARANQALSFAKRNNDMLTIAMCDVDHFKQKNDAFGHPAGDRILRELAQILTKAMRKEDILARYGGEEFIMLLRGTPEAAATVCVEKIRQTVMQHPFAFQDKPIPTTISIGVCSRQATAVESLQDLIQAADDALYRAKQNGRNRLEIG